VHGKLRFTRCYDPREDLGLVLRSGSAHAIRIMPRDVRSA
jgi:hypothetical protein